MHNQFPHFSHTQRLARATAKRELLLHWLASGEIYTSLSLAARLMSVSQSSAQRTLNALVRDGSIKFEPHYILSRKTFIYGITTHGLALRDKYDVPYFQLGKTNSSYITHHLQTQQARLSAEASGWIDWQPGKTLYGQNLAKVPDAIATSPAGTRVAIEIERHIKTPKNYEEVIAGHLMCISKRLWSEVHYLTPAGLSKRVQKSFERVTTVPVNGDRVALEQAHRNRFKFFELQDWPTGGI